MALVVDWTQLNPPLTKEEIEKGPFAVGIAMMTCGMREVKTDQDIEEIYVRMEVYDRLTLSHAIRNTDGENLNRLDLWRRWRGVSINIAVTEKRHHWLTRIVQGIFQEIEYDMRQTDSVLSEPGVILEMLKRRQEERK